MVLNAKNIGFYYSKNKWIFRHINLNIKSDEVLGLLAPSGYGKSTFAKIIAGYEHPKEGFVTINGNIIPQNGYYPVQLIYQNPEKAVNPLWTMDKILTESGEPDELVISKLKIRPEWFSRYPEELSGGELQRFCIARVLKPETKFLVADEITTMFDAVTQAVIWKLLLSIVKEFHIGILVITHDSKLAEKVCDRVITL